MIVSSTEKRAPGQRHPDASQCKRKGPVKFGFISGDGVTEGPRRRSEQETNP